MLYIHLKESVRLLQRPTSPLGWHTLGSSEPTFDVADTSVVVLSNTLKYAIQNMSTDDDLVKSDSTVEKYTPVYPNGDPIIYNDNPATLSGVPTPSSRGG